MRILIYAREGDAAATAKLDELKADFRAAGRRNADLWSGNLEPARAVFVFPNLNADTIAAAYRAAGVTVEVIGETQGDQSSEGNEAEEIQAGENESQKAEENGEGAQVAPDEAATHPARRRSRK